MTSILLVHVGTSEFAWDPVWWYDPGMTPTPLSVTSWKRVFAQERLGTVSQMVVVRCDNDKCIVQCVVIVVICEVIEKILNCVVEKRLLLDHADGIIRVICPADRSSHDCEEESLWVGS